MASLSSFMFALTFLLFLFVGLLMSSSEAAIKRYQFDIQVKNVSEWWNNDVEEIVKQGNKMGLPPNMSDAHTINGKPGPLFPCSEKHTFAMEVEQGKTYLLRIINAALNDELFFAIAGHNMTVVEVDAVYTKPFTTQAILIAPGQTTNVLVHANQVSGRYFMGTKAFMDAPVPVDNKTATGILQYKNIPNTVLPVLPQLPASNDTGFALSYNKKLRSLNSAKYPANVPLNVDRNLFYTIGLGKNSCPTCLNGTRFLASINNVSFVMPQIALLQAHYFNIKGVWFMHCHLELHTGWGLKTAFLVENGPEQSQSVLPPPKDLPSC
ncbi:hypothetical protein TSUD_242330 [Trifolium subterraneum]|uniref:laccase n=1 Tax=Trifolium subterraneum TaxID=3900 RepID=A0A2Z6NEX0_TRISU|nr:hypothetical protein TSUD_242330 [Trifolium subterraneum]